jgi:uncharacterized membrane protein
MKYFAWLVALFVIAVGLAGIIAPDRVMGLRWIAATQTGLLGIAVLRIAIGVVLIMSAPASRAPKALQVVGALLLLAGLATPLFGVERTRVVLDWEAAQGPWLIRGGAIVALVIGGFFAFVLTPRAKEEGK